MELATTLSSEPTIRQVFWNGSRGCMLKDYAHIKAFSLKPGSVKICQIFFQKIF